MTAVEKVSSVSAVGVRRPRMAQLLLAREWLVSTTDFHALLQTALMAGFAVHGIRSRCAAVEVSLSRARIPGA